MTSQGRMKMHTSRHSGKAFRQASSYLSISSLGATGVAAEYAARKFKSHRSVRQKDLDEAEQERLAQLAHRKAHSLG